MSPEEMPFRNVGQFVFWWMWGCAHELVLTLDESRQDRAHLLAALTAMTKQWSLGVVNHAGSEVRQVRAHLPDGYGVAPTAWALAQVLISAMERRRRGAQWWHIDMVERVRTYFAHLGLPDPIGGLPKLCGIPAEYAEAWLEFARDGATCEDALELAKAVAA